MKYVDFEREHFFSRYIWLAPMTYLFHLLEEFFWGFPNWVSNITGGEMKISGFLVGNSIFMGITILLCSLAYLRKKTLTTFLYFLWTTVLICWNPLFHLYAQYRFKEYSPGYFTGTLLFLPTFYYISYLGIRENFIKWSLWLSTIVLAGLVMLLMLWRLLYHFGPIPWNIWI